MGDAASLALLLWEISLSPLLTPGVHTHLTILVPLLRLVHLMAIITAAVVTITILVLIRYLLRNYMCWARC